MYSGIQWTFPPQPPEVKEKKERKHLVQVHLDREPNRQPNLAKLTLKFEINGMAVNKKDHGVNYRIWIWIGYVDLDWICRFGLAMLVYRKNCTRAPHR